LDLISQAEILLTATHASDGEQQALRQSPLFVAAADKQARCNRIILKVPFFQ